MNILFVCDQNVNRSKTAEYIYSGRLGLNVRSAGLFESAVHVIDHKDINWSDIIIVFEKRHISMLERKFDGILKGKRIINLEIEDEYFYMDEELIGLIRVGMLRNGFNL